MENNSKIDEPSGCCQKILGINIPNSFKTGSFEDFETQKIIFSDCLFLNSPHLRKK